MFARAQRKVVSIDTGLGSVLPGVSAQYMVGAGHLDRVWNAAHPPLPGDGVQQQEVVCVSVTVTHCSAL